MTKITKNTTPRKPSFDEHLMNKQVSVRGLLTHASSRIRTAYRLVEAAFGIPAFRPVDKSVDKSIHVE